MCQFASGALSKSEPRMLRRLKINVKHLEGSLSASTWDRKQMESGLQTCVSGLAYSVVRIVSNSQDPSFAQGALQLYLADALSQMCQRIEQCVEAIALDQEGPVDDNSGVYQNSGIAHEAVFTSQIEPEDTWITDQGLDRAGPDTLEAMFDPCYDIKHSGVHSPLRMPSQPGDDFWNEEDVLNDDVSVDVARALECHFDDSKGFES
eukprot:EC125179.1.p1 GENE.EC125179.1~~EC125179.1.p1  ORF type:complete len:206 (+),score=20.58 EC125179.1:157-774(+)